MELLKKANGNLPRTEEEKQQMIEKGAKAYGEFLTAMGFDFEADENSKKTPYRYAKSFVHDLIAGSINEPPAITNFPNDEAYDGLIIQTNIPIKSLCSHHHREISGVCHIAVLPGTNPEDRLIGLSKFNRVADFFARRLQLQEGLTKQIHDYIDKLCEGNRGVAVIISAKHACCGSRGIKHDSTMKTSQLSGYFFTNELGTRTELFNLIK